MTTPTLPPDFIPLLASFSQGSPDGVMRTEVAGGFPRYGMDWDRGVQTYPVTLLLTTLQFSVWTAFYMQVINKGSLTFSMTMDSGFGPSPHDVNIVPGSYQATRAQDGLQWVVTFSVEAENQAYGLTPSDAQSLVDLYNTYGSGVSDILARLAQFANSDTNVLDF